MLVVTLLSKNFPLWLALEKFSKAEGLHNWYGKIYWIRCSSCRLWDHWDHWDLPRFVQYIHVVMNYTKTCFQILNDFSRCIMYYSICVLFFWRLFQFCFFYRRQPQSATEFDAMRSFWISLNGPAPLQQQLKELDAQSKLIDVFLTF